MPIAPRPSAETAGPIRPRFRICIMLSSFTLSSVLLPFHPVPLVGTRESGAFIMGEPLPAWTVSREAGWRHAA
ncbi:hypothetical protein Acsp03_37210 [Actinomadura sp. NBRC 104412]|nr:hypothetical protein Acsp03_37210 [Actinomadura sp. NBRC 104412]